MSSILIDTDIAIDFLRGISTAKELIIPLWHKQLIYLSILSVYELHAGMLPKELEATQSFIRSCQIENLNIEITELAGSFYQRYRKQGITLTTVDCLIWATAKTNNHQLATRNLKHYPDKSILLSTH